MKMAVATTTHHSYTLCCVTQVSTVRGADVLVVARSFALAIVTMQVKFASFKPMRTPVLGDWAFGYSVNVSNQTESMCVSTLEPIRFCRRGKRTPDTKGSNISMSQVWQWCHTKERHSMDSDVQWSLKQKQTLLCVRVDQEQRDKKRSWPRRFPRDRSRRYCLFARGKAISIEDSTYCAQRSRRLDTVDADEERLSITCSRKPQRKRILLRARETHDNKSREVHKDTVNPMRKTIANPCLGETCICSNVL